MDYVRLARQAARGTADKAASATAGGGSSGATKATEATEAGPALLVYSHVLNESVWLVEDEQHADELERELVAENHPHRLIFTTMEIVVLKGMVERDLATILSIKKHFPGSRVDQPTKEETEK